MKKKDFKELSYTEKLNFISDQIGYIDSFLLEENQSGSWAIDNTIDLNNILIYLNNENRNYYWYKPTNLTEFLELFIWLYEKKPTQLYYEKCETLDEKLTKKLIKSPFPDEVLEEYRMSFYKQYEALRNEINNLEFSNYFIQIGINAHRKGIESLMDELLKSLNTNCNNFNYFSPRGYMLAFCSTYTGFELSKHYNNLKVDIFKKHFINSSAQPPRDVKPKQPKPMKQKQTKAIDALVKEMGKGTALTDAINANIQLYSERNFWNIINKIRSGEFKHQQFTEINK